jgi:integrase
MTYTFARIGAVLKMNVCDYFSQKRRRWIRLDDKGGEVNGIIPATTA